MAELCIIRPVSQFAFIEQAINDLVNEGINEGVASEGEHPTHSVSGTGEPRENRCESHGG